MNMANYIVTKNGCEVSEEALKAVFSCLVNKGDYEEWKNEHIERGVIKKATEPLDNSNKF